MEATAKAKRTRRRLSQASAIIIAAVIGAAVTLFVSRNRVESARGDTARSEEIVEAQSKQIEALVAATKQNEATIAELRRRVDEKEQRSPSETETGGVSPPHPSTASSLEQSHSAPTEVNRQDSALPLSDIKTRCTDTEERLPEPHDSPEAPDGVLALSILVTPDGCWSTAYLAPKRYRLWAAQTTQPIEVRYINRVLIPLIETRLLTPSEGRFEFDFGENREPAIRLRNTGRASGVVTLLFYQR